MPGLTPEEQAFFDSGGDTSKLNLPPQDPGVQGQDPIAPPQPSPSNLDMAGLSNADPVAPVATPAPTAATQVVDPPAPDPNEFLRSTIVNTQAQIQQLAQKIAEMQGAATKSPEVVAPDPNDDPLGSVFHRLDNLNQVVLDMKKQLVDQQAQQEQAAAFNRFHAQVTNLRNEFASTHTDFDAAYKYIRDARSADLRAFGISEADIQKQLFQEEFALSQRCVEALKNPAAEIYEMAKRHGYKAVAPTATPVPTAAPTVKMDILKKGVEGAPPTLPRTPGVEDISVESLRDASDADLNKLVTDPAAWAKIAGTDRHPI